LALRFYFDSHLFLFAEYPNSHACPIWSSSYSFCLHKEYQSLALYSVNGGCHCMLWPVDEPIQDNLRCRRSSHDFVHLITKSYCLPEYLSPPYVTSTSNGVRSQERHLGSVRGDVAAFIEQR